MTPLFCKSMKRNLNNNDIAIFNKNQIKSRFFKLKLNSFFKKIKKDLEI